MACVSLFHLDGLARMTDKTRSTMKTVNWRANDPELRMLSRWDWGAGLYYPMLRKFWDTFFYGDFEKYGKQRFHEHYAEVRSLVPKERLLEYRIGEGWAPLCEFLGHKVPEVPFPNVNDSSSFVDQKRARNRAQMMNVAFRWLVVGLPMVVATSISASMALNKFGVPSIPAFTSVVTSAS